MSRHHFFICNFFTTLIITEDGDRPKKYDLTIDSLKVSDYSIISNNTLYLDITKEYFVSFNKNSTIYLLLIMDYKVFVLMKMIMIYFIIVLLLRNITNIVVLWKTIKKLANQKKLKNSYCGVVFTPFIFIFWIYGVNPKLPSPFNPLPGQTLIK